MAHTRIRLTWTLALAVTLTIGATVAPAQQFCLDDAACDDANPCTVDRCSLSCSGVACVPRGSCDHFPAAPGTVCRPANSDCDAAETCSGTQCQPMASGSYLAIGLDTFLNAGIDDFAESL